MAILFSIVCRFLKDLPGFDADCQSWKHGDGPGPFGSKGMSQTTIVTVAPAVGNAIYDAVGARVRSLTDFTGKDPCRSRQAHMK